MMTSPSNVTAINCGRRRWTLTEALSFVRLLEGYLTTYHVAITGGVLFRGYSDQDLDLLIYPHTTASEQIPLRHLLERFGLKRRLDCEFIHREWRRNGSEDTKYIEVYYYGRKRIDIFQPWRAE